MRIHQSSCNKDYSCGSAIAQLRYCSAFSRELGSSNRRFLNFRKRPRRSLFKVSAGNGYRIIMPGIGVRASSTINALLATAALMDGKCVHTLDQTGLAQKGGAVVSHIVVSDRPMDTTAKINSANADLLIGFDLLGAVNPENLKCAAMTGRLR